MSDLDVLISFEELNHLLVPAGALNSPSQLHGWLCGLLSGGKRMKSEDWLNQAMDFLDVIPSEDQASPEDEMKMKQAVAKLYDDTLKQLQDSGYRLQLLLPNDDAELSRRTESLGEWCHGFLSGFGAAGLKADTSFSEESADALRDMAAIVSIGDGSDEEENDAEASLFEIGEYVRMAVLTLFVEFGSQADKGNHTVH